MKTNKLFRDCLAEVDEATKAEFELAFAIAERLSFLLDKKGMSQRQFAEKMGKRESEISKWLTGRHNFTTNTLARISLTLGEPIVAVVSPTTGYKQSDLDNPGSTMLASEPQETS